MSTMTYQFRRGDEFSIRTESVFGYTRAIWYLLTLANGGPRRVATLISANYSNCCIRKKANELDKLFGPFWKNVNLNKIFYPQLVSAVFNY